MSWHQPPMNIENIRSRYAHYGPTEKLKPNTAVLHIRQLLDHIDYLQESVDAEASIAMSVDESYGIDTPKPPTAAGPPPTPSTTNA